MEFLKILGINSTAGVIGFGLLVIGGFLILTGFDIISIEKVTVKSGKRTWIVGIIFAVIGLVFLVPEFSMTDSVSETPVSIVEPTTIATVSTSDSNSILTDWKSIEFAIPGDGLWHKTEGSYTAIGSKDTIAWSDDTLSGDLEISLDIESSNSYAAANIIVYGNGESLTSGNLIFTIASDLLAIIEDSIYGDDNYLFSDFSSLNFIEQKHTVIISIIDRKATLFLDGEKISSIFLKDTINTTGKIGLLKYWEIDEIIFSNIRVRQIESGN